MKRLEAANQFQKRSISIITISLFLLLHFNLNDASAGSKSATVKEILDQPRSYQLFPVMLHGTVTSIKKIVPYQIGGVPCYNSYSFNLTDETGSIQVFVQGFCGPQRTLPPEVKEGEAVFVEATVQVIEPTMYPQEIVGADQGIRVLASKIWR